MALIGKNIGNYRVIAKLGEGGMGIVYLGEHPLIGKKVAIKVLHEELSSKEDIVARFFNEAKAVNAIGHPNIVDVVDYGRMKDDDTGADVVYFVMEFLDGEGLHTRLKREGVSIADAVHIADQVASALSASHAKGIIHRDLKPENVYLLKRGDDRNYVKLLDFGIAKLTGGDSGLSQNKTRTGLVIGTPSYMSPEQCDGKGNIDFRADVYALGIVLYEMLTGQVPFPGDGFGEVLVAHLTRPAPLPTSIRPDIPPALEAIVMHAIEKKKDRRFQSMEELRTALQDPEAHFGTYTPSTGMTGVGVAPGTSPSQAMAVLGGQGQAQAAQAGGAAATVMLNAPQAARATSQVPVLGANKTAIARGPITTTEGPRPTTLSGASGEVTGASQQPPRSRSRAPLFAALGAVVAAAGLGVYFFALHKPEPPRVIVTAPPPPEAPKAPEKVKVTIETRPAGAQLFRAGRKEPVGTTPFEIEAQKGEPDFDLVIKMDGYKQEVKTITTGRDHDMLIVLTKVEAPAPVAAVEPEPEKKKSSSSSSKPKKDKKGTGTYHDSEGTLEPNF